MKSKYLVLPIKEKWFKMILSGEKKEEYREIKPFYEKRLRHHVRGQSFYVIFRNGYGRSVPSCLCKCVCCVGEGLPAWGAEKGKEYFVLVINQVVPLTQRENRLYIRDSDQAI